MPDYNKTGLGAYGRGTMRISDNGSQVRLQVHVAWGSTNWGSVGYSFSGAGGSGSGSFGYPSGSPWITVRILTVTRSGNVTWTINNTGTSEFGGPHTQTAYITRAPAVTVPPAPTNRGFTAITHTTATVTFQSTGHGGSAVLEWQSSFGTNAQSIEGSGNSKYKSNGTLQLSGLKPGTAYHAWHRGRNSKGWGPWSKAASMRTLAGGWVKVGGVWKQAVPYVKVNNAWKPAVPYVKSGGTWKITNS